jgi:hypothetical protein
MEQIEQRAGRWCLALVSTGGSDDERGAGLGRDVTGIALHQHHEMAAVRLSIACNAQCALQPCNWTMELDSTLSDGVETLRFGPLCQAFLNCD